MFKLVIQDDEGKTTVVPLIRDEITIGRKEGNTIRLTERNVSRRHARILRSPTDVQIEDLGSYNGIRVNNARIAERVSLRVSDQVQIGDYKLYLKAEGVEQVDDARTMPIERVDSQIQTEAMAALSPPTQPMPTPVPVTPAVGTIPPSGSPTSGLVAPGQLVGNANRTQVALGDTDPSGRPVASAAAVAALTSTTGYGKLVVLSSNFAGRELELSRPQMIIGRTDENDLVINHRSISRNHAKIVREPETGRYTISDLQSSNGVRVNGQDYRKVELRRGDVVDLGHVRLRFVEPGEDFVFARDAVVTDVPEGGSKKGLMVAVLLGIAVLGGAIALFAMKGKSGDDASKGSGSGQVALPTTPADAPQVADVADAQEMTAPPSIDAPSAANPPTNNVALDKLHTDCSTAKANKDWTELDKCADKLAKLDPDGAKMFHGDAKAELRASIDLENLRKAAGSQDNLRAAKESLDAIPTGSVYHATAASDYAAAEKRAIAKATQKANDYVRAKDCAGVKQHVKQLESSSTPAVADAARPYIGKCEAATQVAANPPPNNNPPPDKDPPPRPRPPANCADAEETINKAQQQFSAGFATQALNTLEAALACKSDIRLVRTAALYSCRSKNAAQARKYYAKIDAKFQSAMIQACQQEGVTLP